MPIRLKLTVIFLSIAIIPLLFVSVLTFTSYRNSLEVNRIADLQTIAFFKADKIETYFAGLKADIQTAQGFYNIKKNIPILSALFNQPANPDSVSAKKMLDGQLQQMQSVLGLSDIILFDSKGLVIYASDAQHYSRIFLGLLPDAGQKAFQAGKNGVYFSDILLNKDSKNPEMLVAAPAFNFDGSFIGVIVFDVDMDPIYKLIQDVNGLGQTGETLIGKKIGDQVLFLNPLRHDPQAAFNKKIRLGEKIGVAIQSAAQGKSGSGQLIDYRGKKVIAAWRYLRSLDWGLVAKIDAKEALSEATNLRDFLILILFIVSLLCGLVAFLIARSISMPILKLSKGAEIIGSGNLDYKVSNSLKDEIGHLSRVFDKMTQDLKSVTASRDELNKEIIERKKAEEDLRQTRIYLDNLFNFANAPIICWDAQFNIIRFNSAFERLADYTAAEVFGQDLGLLFPENIREETLAKIKRTSGHNWKEEEIPILRKDGEIRIVLWNSANVYADDGLTLLATIAHGQDITARKKIADALREANRELELRVAQRTEELIQANAALEDKKRLSDIGTLAATVAHELRNPLAAIKMAAYNIKRKANNSILDKHIANIDTKVSESEQIIDNLLFYSRLKTPRLEQVNIHEVLNECIDSAVERFTKFNVTLEKDIEFLRDVVLEADLLQIKEVFNNILNNAFEALPEHKGDINITAAIENGSVAVHIKDSGAGIDKEHLDKVCNPFFTTKAKGTGLGLTVCSQVMRLHQGRIDIESQKGSGTTVTLTMPVRRIKDA